MSPRLAALLACAWLGTAAAAPLASTPLSRTDLPWWKARLAEKAAELHQGPIDLVFYGDSITQDFELSGPERWRAFEPVWNHYYAGRHAINLGFKGDTTAHLLWRIENGEATGITPKVAVVLIGANNFGRLRWPESETEPGIERIVAELHRRLPGVHPSIRNDWVNRNTAELNRALAARYHDASDATFLDLSALFLTHGHIDPDKFLDPHLTPPDPPLHPSAATMAAMSAAIEPTLSRLLGDAPRPPM
jgi:lysophospholipase L1-like esterase